jgi:hypothetical protein
MVNSILSETFSLISLYIFIQQKWIHNLSFYCTFFHNFLKGFGPINIPQNM